VSQDAHLLHGSGQLRRWRRDAVVSGATGLAREVGV
ncbi:MAG: hypothetical protein AVDCRST_MAG80-89, partial [uncultured Rubrobacteraceae bacterium]